MKIVYYRTLLKKAKNITPDERILYSFLVSKSITEYHEVFDKDGCTVNQDALSELLNQKSRIEVRKINNTQIAKELGITRRSVINATHSLIEKRFISLDCYGEKCVFISKELFEQGYFELIKKEKLKGELLIFYSYLIDKSKRYCYCKKKECDYCLDTHRYKLAEEFGTTEDAIKKHLQRLYRLGLAERLENGKLKINQ